MVNVFRFGFYLMKFFGFIFVFIFIYLFFFFSFGWSLVKYYLVMVIMFKNIKIVGFRILIVDIVYNLILRLV